MFRYIRKNRPLDGIPARDLTDEEVARLGIDPDDLTRHGVYEYAAECGDDENTED